MSKKDHPLNQASRVVATGLLTAQEAYKASMHAQAANGSKRTAEAEIRIETADLQSVVNQVRAAMNRGATSCELTGPATGSVRRFLQDPPYLYRFSGEGLKTVSWQPAWPVHLQER